MRNRRKLTALAAVFGLVAAVGRPVAATADDVATPAGELTVAKLTADSDVDPLGVDAAAPRLAWALRSVASDARQSAYQVRVAATESAFASGGPLVWDSSVTQSAQSAGVDYAGPALQSATRYFWQVRVWDGDGTASPWSATAWWETGLLKPAAWSGAQWIAQGSNAPKWPAGTVATASSTHPHATNGFDPSTALDDNPVTFWNDNTIGAFPDWLQISSPTAVTLPGVTVVTHPSGGAEDFTVDALDGAGSWQAQATVTGDTDVTRYVKFDAPVRTTAVRITVTRDWEQDPSQQWTRIAEVVPGQFAGFPSTTSTPLFRTQFDVAKQVERARAYISGLGYYVLSIDGKRVGDRVLDPAFTAYDKSAEYATYDVTSAVAAEGTHAVGVVLGRGFYGLNPGDTKYWGGAPWLSNAAKMILKLQIDYTDGSSATVVSDGNWPTHDGPTTSDSIYLGETYDARLAVPGWDRPGFDVSDWGPAAVVDSPTAQLVSERVAPIRVVGSMEADKVTNPKPGSYVFHFPTVIAGWAKLQVKGQVGSEVTMRYGERLRADGTVDNDGDPGLTNGPVQTDRYILSGRPGLQTWQPSFSYKGFQYIQVDGYPDVPDAHDVQAQIVHTDVSSTGSFDSSNPLLNTIHDNTRRTILNNLHSILTDTPEFEKRGWLDDASILGATTTDNFAMRNFYRNWLISIQADQNSNGAGVELAPNPYPAGYADPEWAGALVLVPWQVYQDYGDEDVLRESFESMARYVDYLTTQANNYIQPGFYGDWASPNADPVHETAAFAPPEGPQLTGTAYYFKEAMDTAAAARVLGRTPDAQHFAELADRIKAAFNAKFLDTSAGIYRTDRAVGYRQTSNAVPLTFGLVPPALVSKVAANLAADVQARGNHLNTGDAGTKELLPALSENGYADVAFAVATQTSYPSWGYQIGLGATTLWERWEKVSRSYDHAFEGTIDDWFYRDLAGIKPAAPGYAKIDIEPHVPGGLDRAAATQQTAHGTVSSAWAKTEHTLHLRATVPANTTATVHVPLFGHGLGEASPGARLVRSDDDEAVYAVGSGSWEFTSHNPPVIDVSVTPTVSSVTIPPTGRATAEFTVQNLTNHDLAVTPEATTSAGYGAGPVQPLDVPAFGARTVNVQLTAESGAGPGSVTLTVAGISAKVLLEQTDDWIRVATMTASSSYGGHPASSTNDGNTDSSLWDDNQGWNDDTYQSFPDTLTATWDQPVTLRKAVVYTLDSTKYPAAQFGIRDYDVQALVDGQWQTLATVRGNVAGTITSTFGPVATTSLRLSINDTNDHAYSRVIEFEGFSA
jgi:alpha-L-rhamnosidase